MSSVVISGNTSGSVTLDAPAVAGSTTYTLAAVSGTVAPLVSGTAQASTSGTSIDFTGIPSWVKRITVMFDNVSTSGTSSVLIQLGHGVTPTFVTTGYIGETQTLLYSTGFRSDSVGLASSARWGASTLSYFNNNKWAFSTLVTGGNATYGGGISPVLPAVLTAIRITTINGTDTFDSGSINILYE